MSTIILYSDKTDGRVYWIDERHPKTDEVHAVCRVVENRILQHTAVKSRVDLKAYLLTEIKDGIINLGCYPERLNGTVETANSKA